MRFVLVVWAISAAALALSGSAAATSPPFDIEAYLAFQQAVSVAVSSDGSRTAVAVESFDQRSDARRSEIRLFRGRTYERSLGEGGAPQFCYGASLGALRRDGAASRFRILDFPERDRYLEAPNLSVSAFSCDPSAPRAVLVGASVNPPADLRTPPPEEHVFLFDFRTGEVRPLSDAPSVSSVAWSPTRPEIAIATESDIEIIDLAGVRRALVTRTGVDIEPIWSPNGEQLLFATADGQERAPVALAIVGRAGGEPQPVARDFHSFLIGPAPRWFGWESEDAFAFTGVREMNAQVYHVDLARPNAVRAITPERQSATFCANRERQLACIESSPTEFPRLVRRALPNGHIQGAATFNDALPRPAADVQRLDWRSADGASVTGLLMTPAGGCRARCALVVLMMGSHGTFDYSFTGRNWADGSWFPPINAHLLTSAGYAVLMPNPRGSWGFGQEFQRAIIGDPAIGPTADIESGVNAAIAAGVADPQRLAIVGIGYFDAYRLSYDLTQTTRYRAAISVMPVFNLAQWYGAGGTSQRYLGGSPLLEPDRFAAIDPARNAERITTPTLSFELDRVAPDALVGQAASLATALRDKEIDTEIHPWSDPFILWPTPSATRENAVQTLDFLQRHLNAGAPTP